MLSGKPCSQMHTLTHSNHMAAPLQQGWTWKNAKKLLKRGPRTFRLIRGELGDYVYSCLAGEGIGCLEPFLVGAVLNGDNQNLNLKISLYSSGIEHCQHMQPLNFRLILFGTNMPTKGGCRLAKMSRF